jgi:hypothetical protein
MTEEDFRPCRALSSPTTCRFIPALPEFPGDPVGDAARNKRVASQHRVWPSLFRATVT